MLQDLQKHVIDSSSSEAINYSATRRARSRKEFVAKMGLVAEEATKTSAEASELAWLQDESTQFRAIFVQSYATAKENYERMVEERKAAAKNRRAKQILKSSNPQF